MLFFRLICSKSSTISHTKICVFLKHVNKSVLSLNIANVNFELSKQMNNTHALIIMECLYIVNSSTSHAVGIRQLDIWMFVYVKHPYNMRPIYELIMLMVVWNRATGCSTQVFYCFEYNIMQKWLRKRKSLNLKREVKNR